MDENIEHLLYETRPHINNAYLLQKVISFEKKIKFMFEWMRIAPKWDIAIRSSRQIFGQKLFTSYWDPIHSCCY